MAELDAYYNNYPAGEDTSPLTLLRYDELLDRFKKYRAGGSMLDVGCGGGHFLAQAAKHGWRIQGTETGQRQLAACRAKGVPVIAGPLNIEDHPAEGYDVICSFEVIEHVTHPAEEIGKMVALLRPGGLLYVTTPNFNCLARRLDPTNWSVANYPEHLNYFTPATLHRLLHGQGLHKKWLVTTGFSVSRWKAKGASTKEERDAAKQYQEALRSSLESKWHLKLAKRLANTALNGLELGDSMKAGYVKPPAVNGNLQHGR